MDTEKPLKPLELKKLRQTLNTYLANKGSAFNLASFYDPERDGLTYSALSAFRRCREYSRLNLKGVTSRSSSLSLVFGEIAHGTLEAVYTSVRHGGIVGVPSPASIMKSLQGVEAVWKQDNPRASAESLKALEFTMIVAEATLPVYFKYWGEQDRRVRWVDLEHEFRIPFTTRVGSRTVNTFVRGKMDGVFKDHGHRLLETKTKSHIDDMTLADILPHELQVNLYLWAIRRIWSVVPTGVRYNLIRRPQLRQRQRESVSEFARRCAEDVRVRPDWYFMRLDMDVDRQDLDRFEGEFDGLVRDFLAWWYGETPHYRNSDHCENKYGKCPMLAWCARRDSAGLYRRDKVFRELEEI